MEDSVQEGRYRIVRKLGEGGQGEVYLVEHPEAVRLRQRMATVRAMFEVT